MTEQTKSEGFPGQRIVVLPRSVADKARENPLLRRLTVTDIGIFPNAEGHARERLEGIAQGIFIYCTKGNGWCEIRNHLHEIHEGELLVVPPGEPHAYGADLFQPWTIHWFHVAGGNVSSLMFELGITPEKPVIYLGEDPRLLAIFEETLAVLEQGYTIPHLLYSSRILEHLIGLMIWRARENWRGEPDSRQKIARSITYIAGHLDQHLNLGMMARMASLSVSHFNRLFHQETGYPCMEYITRQRIAKACQWFDTTDWPLKDIAARLGYEDPIYFARVFTTIQGVSPKEYRSMRKG